jgi:hypothetical protein
VSCRVFDAQISEALSGQRPGALAHWRIGALAHWRIGALAHWRIGAGIVDPAPSQCNHADGRSAPRPKGRHKCPTAAFRLLTRVPTIACKPRLAVTHWWGSALCIEYETGHQVSNAHASRLGLLLCQVCVRGTFRTNCVAIYGRL